MKRLAIISEAIRSAGHDPDSQTMEVEFPGGTLYLYSDVPAEVFADFMRSDSKGTYFAHHIRDIYPHTRIR